jgi:hypothetical protein
MQEALAQTLVVLQPMDDFEQTTYTALAQASALQDQAALLEEMLGVAISAAEGATFSLPAGGADHLAHGVDGRSEGAPCANRTGAVLREGATALGGRTDRIEEGFTPMDED